MRTIFAVFVAMLFLIRAASSQVAAEYATGVAPIGSYSGGNFDTVDVGSGNLSVHIPLFSLPQKGKLSMSFSLVFNSNSFHFDMTCDAKYSGCNAWALKGTSGIPTDLQIIRDQSVSFLQSTPPTVIPSGNYVFYDGGQPTVETFGVTWPVLVDAQGGQHQLGFDSNNWDTARATDGSGYTRATTPIPGYVGNHIYWNGQVTGPLLNADGVCIGWCPNNAVMSDPLGNTIQMQNPSDFSSAYVDSVQRVIPQPPPLPQVGSGGGDLSKCPNLGVAEQPAQHETDWTVPGSNGTVTYRVCFTGVSFETEFWGYPNPLFAGTSQFQLNENPNPPANNPAQVLGLWDASGATEEQIQSVVLPNGTYWGFIYSPSARPSYGDLSEIILPTGGTISYTYANAQIGCIFPDTIYDLHVKRFVTSRTVNDGFGHISTTNYTTPGSGTVTETGPTVNGVRNDTVHTFSDLGVCDLYETDTKYYNGPKSSGTLLKEVSTTYQTVTSPQAYHFPEASHASNVVPKTVKQYLNGSLSSTTTYGYTPLFTDSQPQCAMNPTFTCSTQNATSPTVFQQPSETTVTGSAGELLSHTLTTFLFAQKASYMSANMLKLPGEQKILNSSSQTASDIIYCYDESSSPLGTCGGSQGTYGNQTSVQSWLNTSNTWLKSSSIYSSIGVPTSTADTNGNTTSYTYDNTGIFLSKVQYPTTNGVSHIEYFSHDQNTGKLTSHTDQNGSSAGDPGHTTTYVYDDVGNLTETDHPDGGTANISYNGYANPLTITTTETASPDPSIVTSQILDGLGRTTQTKITSDTAGTDYTDTTYDNLERVSSVSNPYRSTGDSTYGITSYSYDALGRKTMQCQQDNGTGSNPCIAGNSYLQWVYTGDVVDSYDETKRHSQHTTDGLGRLTKVLEQDGSTNLTAALTFETDYTYDALSNLTNVNQHGLTRTFTYDSLSRLVCSANPEIHTAICPATASSTYTPGTIAYSYDADSNLISKIAPAPNAAVNSTSTVTTTYSYDTLNRMTGKSYSDGVTPSTTLTYDQTTDAYGNATGSGIGRLTSESTGSGTAAWSAAYHYDPMGRIAQKRQLWGAHPSWAPYMFYQYDLVGNPTMADNGESRRFYFTYDGAGRAIKVITGPANGTIDGTLVSNVSYLPVGEYFTELGNGAEVRHFYDNRLRLNAYRFAPSPSDYTYLDAWNVTYDENGNVTGTGDLYVQGVWTNTYDNLNRLVTASNTWGPACQYSYDSNGNRLTQAPYQSGTCLSSTLSYTGNRITTPGYQYDAAGNLISDGVTAYGYDAENRLISVHNNTTTATYQYSPEGDRISSTVNGVYKTFSYDPDGHLGWTNYGSGTPMDIYFNGRHFGYLYTNSDQSLNRVIYSSVDHLGTEQVRVDGNQNIIGKYNHLPFGDGQTIFAGTDDDTLHYTGKERDTESGLDYFGARYYASNMGRWMSPDYDDTQDVLEPIPYADLTNPQSLNLYGVAGNDPLSIFDVDGHQVAPPVKCNWLCTFWMWLNTPSPSGQAAEGASKEIGNTFQSFGNLLDRNVGNGQNQRPLQPITGVWQQRGATAAGVGMLFVPGGGEADGLQVLSRDQLLAEAVNPAVRNAIGMFFREGATIGDGSTAAAIEHELATGEKVGGRSHLIKGPELMTFLKRIKAGEKGALNPREEVIIQAIIDRLQIAVEKIGAPQ